MLSVRRLPSRSRASRSSEKLRGVLACLRIFIRNSLTQIVRSQLFTAAGFLSSGQCSHAFKSVSWERSSASCTSVVRRNASPYTNLPYCSIHSSVPKSTLPAAFCCISFIIRLAAVHGPAIYKPAVIPFFPLQIPESGTSPEHP